MIFIGSPFSSFIDEAYQIGKAIADYKHQLKLDLLRNDPLRQAQAEWYRARATQAIPAEAEWRKALAFYAIPAEAEWRKALAFYAIPAEASYYSTRAKALEFDINVDWDWFKEALANTGIFDLIKSIYGGI